MSSILKISNDISLRVVTLNDADVLQKLMHHIYPPPYKHLWEDNGDWYVEETFNKVVLQKELSEVNADYYFVAYQKKTIGILRIVDDVPLTDFPDLKATKLHRIYLDPEVQGKGIGLLLMNWAKEQAIKNDAQLLWLEAMDTQQQALQFYKKLGYTITGNFRLTFELMHSQLRGMHRMYLMLS